MGLRTLDAITTNSTWKTQFASGLGEFLIRGPWNPQKHVALPEGLQRPLSGNAEGLRTPHCWLMKEIPTTLCSGQTPQIVRITIIAGAWISKPSIQNPDPQTVTLKIIAQTVNSQDKICFQLLRVASLAFGLL